HTKTTSGLCAVSRLFVFFLHYIDHLLTLHSFPTRRSSDLDDTHRKRPARMLCGIAGDVWPGTTGPSRLPGGDGTADPGEGGRESDRKSTRLNSSHRTISYAVFCLKQKTSPLIRKRCG